MAFGDRHPFRAVTSGGAIDTASLGAKTFAVSATDRAGNPGHPHGQRPDRPLSLPDLVETALSNPPSIALPGSSFAATDTVLNQGGATAAASTTRAPLSLDAVKDSGDILLAAAPGRSRASRGAPRSVGLPVTLTIPSTTPLRKYYLLACADDAAVVTETDDGQQLPGLAGDGSGEAARPCGDGRVLIRRRGPPPGSSFKVVDTVQNQGLVVAAASTTRYYLAIGTQRSSQDTRLSGSRSVPILAPGAESGGKAVTVTIPSTMPLGTFYLLACADDTNLALEGEETNNCGAAAMPVRVTRADVVQTAVSNPPSAVAPGDTFKLTDTVLNQGLVAAASTKTRYYLSTDQQKTSGDTMLTGSRSVPSLAPGASSAGATLRVTVPSTTSLGLYYLLACADDTAVVRRPMTTTTASRRGRRFW